MANNENLKHWAPGQSGNPKGRPKGLQSWSTLVRQLLDDTKLAEKIYKLNKQDLPVWWQQLPNKNFGTAIIIAMQINATKGDTKAATWLRKTGYGDKLDITTND